MAVMMRLHGLTSISLPCPVRYSEGLRHHSKWTTEPDEQDAKDWVGMNHVKGHVHVRCILARHL